jgi:hypothetical protein
MTNQQILETIGQVTRPGSVNPALTVHFFDFFY